MVVRSDSVFISELSIHPLEKEAGEPGAVAAPVSDNPITVFRGFAFGIAFQFAAALVAYALWHMLRHLF